MTDELNPKDAEDWVPVSSPIPSHWTHVEFEEAFLSISLSNIKVPQTNYLTVGRFPVIDQGKEIIGGYTNDEGSVINKEDSVVVFGDHTKCFKFVDFPFAPGADGTKVLKPAPFLSPKYAYYACLSLRLPDRGYSRHYSFLKKAKFPVAPLAEQDRIVAKLEELFSEIDKGIENLTAAREQLKAYRQAALKQAFEGKLTEDWRLNNLSQLRSAKEIETFLEGARRNALEKSGGARNKPPIPFDKADLPACPDEWSLVSMDSLCHHITSGSRDWSRFYDHGISVFVMAQNIRPGRYDGSVVQHVDPPMENAETERTRVQANDILVTIVGANTGNVCRFPLQSTVHYVCQSVALMRLSCPEYARFVELYFQSRSGGQRQYTRYIYGAGRPHLSFEQLKQTVVPIPDPREAEKIVDAVDAIFSQLAVTESMIDAELARAASLRHSILRTAFSGQLVSQDASDEPASVLVGRLRARQEEGSAKKRRNYKNGKEAA